MVMKKMMPYVYFFTFCINHTPNKPGNKSNQIPGIFSNKSNNLAKKLKTAPITENVSTVIPASSLRASASLFNHFFKVTLSFGGDVSEQAGSPPLLKPPVIASTFC